MKCAHCDRDATVAILTRRPTRAKLWTRVYWEESVAPAAAERLCGMHAEKVLAELCKVLA